MRSFALAVLALAVAIPAQNQGLAFTNGTTGYVDYPNDPTFVPGGGLTAEAWITYNGALGPGWRFPTILRMDPSPNLATYFLRIEAGQTQTNRLLWWVSTTSGSYTTTWNFPAGTLSAWTHVAGTYDGSFLRLFVNGAQVAQTAGTGPLLPTSGVFRIGSGDLSVTGGETWDGEIDEVRIWPFARSAAAIAATMNLQLHSMPGEVSTFNLEGITADSSGTNNGTLVGAAAFVANTRPQQTIPWNGLTAYGYGSGCQSAASLTVNSLANVGNQAFEFVGLRAATSPLGFLLLGFSALPLPVPIFGVDVFPDLAGGLLVPVVPNPLGTGAVPVPIPNTPAVQGFGMHVQFAWLDTCASGFSASSALATVVVP